MNHSSRSPAERRRAAEEWTYGKKTRDEATGITSITIISGDCYVTRASDEMLVTILGSCVAACIRDPIARIGGMNHFLLPGDANDTPSSEAARYGVFAMEKLINGILAGGGRKDRFEIKVFGGGNVLNNSQMIGSKNADFVRRFLKREGYPIQSEDLEGDTPRRIHYMPATGKVMMRKLMRASDREVIAREHHYRQSIAARPIEGEIDLF